MSVQKNEATVRTWVEEAWNKGNVELPVSLNQKLDSGGQPAIQRRPRGLPGRVTGSVEN
jgi:hypothetical protein